MEFNSSQLTYLQHLGIDIWLTRPVFKPEESVTLGERTTHLENGVTDSQSFLTGLAVEPITEPVATRAPVFPLAAKNPKSAEPIIQAETQPSEVAPRFNIQFWCYSSGLWVVSGELELAPSHHMLVHNVAQFIHGKKRKPRHVGIFSWPMLDAPNINQGADIAQKYVLQHVEQLQNITPCKKLLAFDDSASWLSDLNPIAAHCSIAMLLQSTELKKSLWQQLLPHQL